MEKKLEEAKERIYQEQFRFINWLSKKYQKDWIIICEEYEKSQSIKKR